MRRVPESMISMLESARSMSVSMRRVPESARNMPVSMIRVPESARSVPESMRRVPESMRNRREYVSTRQKNITGEGRRSVSEINFQTHFCGPCPPYVWTCHQKYTYNIYYRRNSIKDSIEDSIKDNFRNNIRSRCLSSFSVPPYQGFCPSSAAKSRRNRMNSRSLLLSR